MPLCDFTGISLCFFHLLFSLKEGLLQCNILRCPSRLMTLFNVTWSVINPEIPLQDAKWKEMGMTIKRDITINTMVSDV